VKHNHIRLFNRIAPYYSLFYNKQVKSFRKSFKSVDLSSYKTVIDIGAGTGALASVLIEYGLDVTILDASIKMLEVAKKKLNKYDIKTINASITEPLDTLDKSFDLSIASYVAHGLDKEDRLKMYANMKKITKDTVMILEHGPRGSTLLKIAEYLEGGDYFNFIKVVNQELKENFKEVKIIPLSNSSVLYVLKI